MSSNTLRSIAVLVLGGVLCAQTPLAAAQPAPPGRPDWLENPAAFAPGQEPVPAESPRGGEDQLVFDPCGADPGGENLCVRLPDGSTFISPGFHGLYTQAGNPDALIPTTSVRERPDGFDVTYEFINAGTTPGTIGAIGVGNLTLGPNVTVHWPGYGEQTIPMHADHSSLTALYPTRLFSPVMVIEAPHITVGVSLIYPVLHYRHGVRLSLARQSRRADEQNWGLGFQAFDRGNEPLLHALADSEALVLPGERRRYLLSVRVLPPGEPWQAAILPYRDWFHRVYGGVTYDPWPAAVQAHTTSITECITPENPRGFCFPGTNPDTDGWDGWVQRLTAAKGWDGVMLWKPSGMYDIAQDLNMPPQFTSGWLNNGRAAEAIDPERGLSRVARTGRVLGLWWGHSANYAATWNPPELVPFDPLNDTHFDSHMREMELATLAGATLFGMDSFASEFTPVWRQHRWIRELRGRYPNARFLCEPLQCDLLAALTPQFVWLPLTLDALAPIDADKQGRPRIFPSNDFADFLLPGHEIWGYCRPNDLRGPLGRDLTAEDILAIARNIAASGYNPMLATSLPLIAPVPVAERWRETVPQSLWLRP